MGICGQFCDAAPVRLFDYPGSPNCYKVRLALAELGIDYDRVNVDIFAGDTLTEEYGRVNPARTTPVLELDDGTRLVESNAILLHLSEGTELLPEDPVARAQAYAWLFFEQSRIVPFVGNLRFRIQTGRVDLGGERGQKELQLATGVCALVALQLEGREYAVADRFGIADIGLYGYLHCASDAGVDLAPFSALQAWIERVRSRPRHVADLVPIPDQTRPGQGRSLYDVLGV
jgi:glutathione S-transferase